MSLFHITALAQANVTPEDVTAGQMLSGLLVLSVMAGSLVMSVIWATRMGQTGHALPAAQRGILRVPAVLTFVAIGLSLLMLLLMGLVSLEDNLLPPVAVTPAGTAVEAKSVAASPKVNSPQESPSPTQLTNPVSADVATDGNSSEPQSIANTPDSEAAPADVTEAGEARAVDESATDGTEKAAKLNAAKLTPEDMKRALVQTVVMDLFLFVVFGFVVFASSSRGRVCISETTARLVTNATSILRSSRGFAVNSAWPDLDEGEFISQFPGDTVFAERVQSGPAAEGQMLADSLCTAPLEDSFASVLDAEPTSPPEPDEPFSFLAELRYAGEVFLAAYLPTAVLRIIVVLLTVGLLGEEPDQHPFLEMMSSGVGMTVLALILLTAVFLAPVVEELQFRVVLLGGIAQLGHPILALSVSSILFASVHGFPDSLALVPLAFALGYTYLRRRSYITVMMVHFLFNGFNMVLALLAML